MAEAKNVCNSTKLKAQEIQCEAVKVAKYDHLRYLLWIDPTRANAFLSQKVILVEGPTEKALFSFLFNNPKGSFYNESETAKITVIDTVGKYHFYKFANLLNRFKVKVWCIYDGDIVADKKSISQLLGECIEKLKTDDVINGTLRLDPNLEKCLGVVKEVYNSDVAFYVNLEQNTNNCTNSDGYLKIIDFVKEVIAS
jgi:predicted ATP-dependent endonuclease of OLD family